MNSLLLPAGITGKNVITGIVLYLYMSTLMQREFSFLYMAMYFYILHHMLYILQTLVEMRQTQKTREMLSSHTTAPAC